MFGLTIAKKLMLLIVIALLGFVISQGYSQWVERGNSTRLVQVEQKLYPTLELTTVNLGSLLLMEQQINNSVTTGDESALDQAESYYQEIRNNLQKLSNLNDSLTMQVEDIDSLLQDWYSTSLRIARSFIGGNVDYEKVSIETSANGDKLKELRKLLSSMREDTRSEFTSSISETVESSKAREELRWL